MCMSQVEENAPVTVNPESKEEVKQDKDENATTWFNAFPGLLLIASSYPAFAREYRTVPDFGSRKFGRLKRPGSVRKGKNIVTYQVRY